MKRLGYQKVRFNSSGTRCLLLSDNDLLTVDKSLGQLKQQSPEQYEAIKRRYLYKENYREITKQLGKRSPKYAGKLLNEATNNFLRLLKDKTNE